MAHIGKESGFQPGCLFGLFLGLYQPCFRLLLLGDVIIDAGNLYDVLFRHVTFYNDVDVGPHERTVFFKNTYFPAELVCQSSLYVL